MTRVLRAASALLGLLALAACGGGAPPAPASPATAPSPAAQPAPGVPPASVAPPVAAAAVGTPSADAGATPTIDELPDPGAIPPSALGLANGDFVPELRRENLRDGKEFALSRLVGPKATEASAEAVVVGMVASWCGPCAASLPTLKALEDQHAGLRVVLVATDLTREGREKEAEKVAAAGLAAPVLDPQEVDLVAWMGSKRNVPRFFVVNKVGEVLVQDRGFGNKVRAVLPKQVAYALRTPHYVARRPAQAAPVAQDGPDGT